MDAAEGIPLILLHGPPSGLQVVRMAGFVLTNGVVEKGDFKPALLNTPPNHSNRMRKTIPMPTGIKQIKASRRNFSLEMPVNGDDGDEVDTRGLLLLLLCAYGRDEYIPFISVLMAYV